MATRRTKSEANAGGSVGVASQAAPSGERGPDGTPISSFVFKRLEYGETPIDIVMEYGFEPGLVEELHSRWARMRTLGSLPMARRLERVEAAFQELMTIGRRLEVLEQHTAMLEDASGTAHHNLEVLRQRVEMLEARMARSAFAEVRTQA